MDNLNSALTTWNDKLAEIWTLISTSPENFKGGGVWTVIQNINGALQAVGYGLLVLFFAAGVVKTCGSFAELKKPEMAFRCFVRFVLAQAAVGHGMELMTALFSVAQGMVSEDLRHAQRGEDPILPGSPRLEQAQGQATAGKSPLCGPGRLSAHPGGRCVPGDAVTHPGKDGGVRAQGGASGAPPERTPALCGLRRFPASAGWKESQGGHSVSQVWRMRCCGHNPG